MHEQERTIDRATKRILTVIAALLAAIAVELWAGAPQLPSALGQIPDTGLQRQQIVTETRRTNELLEQILDHLKSKPIKVSWEGADKPGGGRAKSARP